VEKLVIMGGTLRGPNTSLGALGDVLLEAASVEAACPDAEPITLAITLNAPLGLFEPV
jgi:hypothetical protein